MAFGIKSVCKWEKESTIIERFFSIDFYLAKKKGLFRDVVEQSIQSFNR